MARTSQLAESLRQAALSVGGDEVSPLLHGHDGDHAAWSVLPNVGHGYANGEVLGLGVWLPRGTDQAERDRCALTLSSVSHIRLNDTRISLRDQAPFQKLPAGLQRSTWSRKARVWASVTTVVLDRHPKRHQHLEQLIADSVEMAGYPRPIRLEIGQTSPVRGVPPARRFQPRSQGRWMHVVLNFERAVRGPLLIGRDRHFGLGLFRPMHDRVMENAHVT